MSDEILDEITACALLRDENEIDTFFSRLKQLEITLDSASKLMNLFGDEKANFEAQKYIANKLAMLKNYEFVHAIFYGSLEMHIEWIQFFYSTIFNAWLDAWALEWLSQLDPHHAHKVALRLINIDLDFEADKYATAAKEYIARFAGIGIA